MNTPDLSDTGWRTSSQAAAGLRPGHHHGGVIAVCDSKDPVGPRLVFSQQTWEAFTSRAKDGAASPS